MDLEDGQGILLQGKNQLLAYYGQLPENRHYQTKVGLCRLMCVTNLTSL
jgi:hypothetical protein